MALLNIVFAQSSKCISFPIKQVFAAFILFLICSITFNISDKKINHFENLNRETLNNQIEYIIKTENNDSEIESKIKEFVENSDTKTKIRNCTVTISQTTREKVYLVNVSYDIQWYNIYRHKIITYYKIMQ